MSVVKTQPLKKKTLLTRVDENEYRKIVAASEKMGMRPATFLRFSGLKNASSVLKTKP